MPHDHTTSHTIPVMQWSTTALAAEAGGYPRPKSKISAAAMLNISIHPIIPIIPIYVNSQMTVMTIVEAN